MKILLGTLLSSSVSVAVESTALPFPFLSLESRSVEVAETDRGLTPFRIPPFG